jgi:fatty acid desaturase
MTLRPTKHFVRHYAEMVAAMFLGMAVLGLPTEWALGAFGSSWSDLHNHAPALMLRLMAVIMTGPMVGWMAHRGHGRRPNAEMAASMLLPTFAVIGLLSAGLVTNPMSLMTLEHAVMLPSMLAAMLLRRDEYSGRCHVAVAS